MISNASREVLQDRINIELELDRPSAGFFRRKIALDKYCAATAILRVDMIVFLKQLATFGAGGPTLADHTSALTRFGVFYFGRLWDVYARSLLSSGLFHTRAR